jgi:hypothetical protein
MIAHVAAGQMLMCGVVKGEKSIANAQFKPAKCPSFRCGSKRVAFRRHSVCRFEKTAFHQRVKTAKADLVADLKASFDYCDPVYESMTDAAGTASSSGSSGT